MHSVLPYQQAKEKLTSQEKVGQLFMPAVFINDTEEEVQHIENLIHNQCIGSICFFHSRASAATNFEGKKKVVHNEKSYDRLKELIVRYQKAAKFPLLVAIDAEWGLAMRIENTNQFPYAITLGAIQDQDELIFEVGKHIALDCRQAGIHWNLAPVVDVNNNPENPVIGYRSFGDNKEKVLSKAKAYLDGMKSVGVLNAIKHFPGHGDTSTDSHLGMPIIDKSLDELKANEVYPFSELITSGVDAVMVGHLAVPALDNAENPATTSSKIITDFLRKHLGFDGIVISDALNMHAVSKNYPEKGTLESTAFDAGMDVMCFSEHPAEGIQQILDSSTTNRIEESFQRFWELKERVFQKMDEEASSLPANHLNAKLAQKSITELYGSPKRVPEIKRSKFLNLAVNNQKENNFSLAISKTYDAKCFEIESESLGMVKKLLQESTNVVLSIFPPRVKPKNYFGFQPEVLALIHEIISDKNVLIYNFGNPYVLDILKLGPSSNVVQVYQDFPEFQEEAFNHFQGLTEAKGKLPIHLKTFQTSNL